MLILPTEDAISFTTSLLHEMTNKDYDLDELISMIMTSLRNSALYPITEHQIMRDDPKHTDDTEAYDLNLKDVETYNQAASYLYHSLYTTFFDNGMYNESDELTMTCFVLHNNALVVSSEPIESI